MVATLWWRCSILVSVFIYVNVALLLLFLIIIIDVTRRDDMISVGYLLVYLHSGTLPWEHLSSGKIEKESPILKKKNETSLDTLTKTLSGTVRRKVFLFYTSISFDL